MPQETYIGDGVYASFDGFQIWLRAPRELGDHVVALEPAVFAELMRLAGQVWPRYLPKKEEEKDG